MSTTLESHSLNADPCEFRDQCPRECCPTDTKGQPVTGRRLSDLRPGDLASVCETCLDADDASLLRAMGLRPNATLRVCRLGDPCIIEVHTAAGGGCACRIGMARELASRVMVVVGTTSNDKGTPDHKPGA